MKIIYKESISTTIDNAIVNAKKLNKKIEKIILNKEEYDELVKEIGKFGFNLRLNASNEDRYAGIIIEKEPVLEFVPANRVNHVGGMTGPTYYPHYETDGPIKLSQKFIFTPA